MRGTENALAHQACVLRSDLEKALQDNASLFSKIGMQFPNDFKASNSDIAKTF